MGKITINELHNSLFDYVQTVSDNKLETNNKTIVGAINELFSDNSNDIEINNLKNEISNGKQLIASAIGEPLNAEDSFNEMSNDINSLLSTFKTNMMNNGVTVNSSDRFKQLIDKIATLADNEGNKVQFVTGFINTTTYLVDEYTTRTWIKNSFTFDSSLDFTPTRLILSFPMLGLSQSVSDRYYLDNYTVDSQMCYDKNNYFHAYESNCNSSIELYITNISNTGFDLYANKYTEYYPLVCPEGINWLAIGVEEEDTTLSGGLDIISATELPATGKKDQICVITDNPVNAFITTTNFDDTNSVSNDYITLYLGNTASSDATEGTLIELNQGNLVSRYYFVKACQGENRLDSYYWLNNQWNRLTQSGIYFVENGVERNHNYFGGIPSGNAATFNSNGLTLLYSYGSPFKQVTTKNTINFSLYDKLDITIKNPDTSTSYYVCVGYASTEHFTSKGWYPTNSTGGNQPTYSNVTDAHVEMQATRGQTINQTIDISSWTGEGWLSLSTFNGNMDLYITDLKLY